MATSKPVQIRFAGYQPPESVHSRAAEVLGDALRRRLGDSVRFELTGDITETGRKAADLLSMVETGAVELCYFASSYLAERVPELEILDLPFTIDDRDQAYRLLDGNRGKQFAAQISDATGFRLLGFWDNGFRHFSNRTRPIRTPADCRGLRIRTLFSTLHQQTFAALGFEPVALDVRELRQAVADGTVDAQENPLTTFDIFGLARYHRYLTLSAHVFGTALLLCNAAAFDSWPLDIREALEAAAAEATEAQRGFAAAEDERVLGVLRQGGTDIVTLSPAERQAFVDAVAPVISEQRKKHGTGRDAPLS